MNKIDYKNIQLTNLNDTSLMQFSAKDTTNYDKTRQINAYLTTDPQDQQK